MTDVGNYNYTRPRKSISAQYSTPGPVYSLPPLVGFSEHDNRSTFQRLPAYTMAISTKLKSENPGPGPAAYYPKSQDFQPAYSMSGRFRNLSKFETPSPAAYSPDTWHPTHVPAYSLGYKPKESMFQTITPAPNAYELPPPHIISAKKEMPHYTLTGRPRSLFSASNAPGPGEYRIPNTDTYKNRAPQYSMGTGAALPSDASIKPAASKYYPNLYATKKSVPAYSFGLKHSPYSGEFMDKVDDEDE